MCFDKICVSYYKMCAVCRKVKFITNITNVTGIHTFYFYNNIHTFITTEHLSLQTQYLLQNIYVLSKSTRVS